MQSVMPPQHDFSRVPEAEIQRSSFDRSHGLKTTFDAGYLVPIFWDLALPGDTFNLSLTAFARLSASALNRPPMDNMYMDFFFFEVPIRQIWTNFPKFMGEQANPGDSTSYSIPQMPSPTTPGILSGSLSDYLGIPVGLAASFNFNSLWHRAYNICFRDWFRDENLQNAPVVDMDDGPDTYADYVLLRRGKRHDYFTSCLPWPQKGTAVSIPLGSTAPVTLTSTLGTAGLVRVNTTHALSAVGDIDNLAAGVLHNIATGESLVYDPAGTLYADLSTATAATINSLRQAFQLQKLYERDARSGTRYIEVVKAHFNVTSPDLRAIRPIYLGGGTCALNINPVAGTNQVGTGATAPGQLSAFATATASGIGFTKSFTEHSVLLGLVSVRADLTYQQGLDRFMTRRTRFDLYWPALAHIGEQAVLNQEIYADGSANDVLVFGYQEYAAEYRYKPSRITGLLRSNVSAGSTSLQVYHLSQNFGSLPTLNTTFIQETPPMSRIKAVTTEPDFIYDSYVKLICARPMPMYGVPGLIDHF